MSTRRAAAVGVLLLVAFVVLVILTTPWHPLPGPVPGGHVHPNAGRDFTPAEIARESAYHSALRPWGLTSLGVWLVLSVVLGFTPRGAASLRPERAGLEQLVHRRGAQLRRRPGRDAARSGGGDGPRPADAATVVDCRGRCRRGAGHRRLVRLPARRRADLQPLPFVARWAAAHVAARARGEGPRAPRRHQ